MGREPSGRVLARRVAPEEGAVGVVLSAMWTTQAWTGYLGMTPMGMTALVASMEVASMEVGWVVHGVVGPGTLVVGPTLGPEVQTRTWTLGPPWMLWTRSCACWMWC